MSDYYPYQDQPAVEAPSVKNNGPALTSMIVGLSGWALYLLSWCTAVLGSVTVVTSFCTIPLWGLSFIGWVVAVILGHVGIGQINASGGAEGGRGMAIAGLISGYLGMLATCLLTIAIVILIAIGGGLGVLGILFTAFTQQQ